MIRQNETFSRLARRGARSAPAAVCLRTALTLVFLITVALAGGAAKAETRALKLYNTHTKERATIVFKRDGSYDNVSLDSILALIGRYGAVEKARQRAHQFTEKARRIMSGFPESPTQRALSNVTNLITGRDH